MKVCTCCKEEKPATKEYFYWRSDHQTLRSECKVCKDKVSKKYYEENKDKVKDYTYFYNVTKKYGLTKEDYKKLWQTQKGCCKICEESFNEFVRPHVDHSHSTGKVRSLLCGACNKGLGHFKDNPDLLLLACDYLLDFMDIDIKEEDECV